MTCNPLALDNSSNFK